MHDSVYDISNGDPRIAKLLRLALQQMERGDNTTLREMASSVLRGDLDLRQAALSDAYGEELVTGLKNAYSEFETLNPDQRADLARQTSSKLDALLDEW